MTKRHEKFPEENRTHGAQSPGVVQDDEDLERRLPPGQLEIVGATPPRSAFPRRDLRGTEDGGGASVDRSLYMQASGQRGSRGAIKARANDIRKLTDAEGNRLWSVIDRPKVDNQAHAEIQREPLGKMPSRAERERFIAVWRGAITLLAELKAKDPLGKPDLQLVPDTGLEIYWRSGSDGHLRRVIQVESVAEAIRVYIGAGLVSEADVAQEQGRLEQELTAWMRSNTQNPRVGTESA